MKTIIYFILITLLSLPAMAQKELFETLTANHAGKDGFSASRITRDMFSLYLKKRNVDENSPVHDALKNLDNILVVTQSGGWEKKAQDSNDSNQPSAVSRLHQELLKHYGSNNYTLFKTGKQMGEDVKVYLRKNKDKIASLAVVTSSDWATSLVELQGDIDLSTVAKLNQALNLRGLENLYKINNSGSRGWHVPVPPVPEYSEQIHDMLEKNRDIIENNRYMSEEQRRHIEVKAHALAEKQMEMAERMKEMSARYGRQPIFLSKPGDSTIFFIDGEKVSPSDVQQLNPDVIERVEVNKNNENQEKATIRITTRR